VGWVWTLTKVEKKKTLEIGARLQPKAIYNSTLAGYREVLWVSGGSEKTR